MTQAADRVCEHRFDLLGSGPVRIGEKIDWHVDFTTGHRWNPRQYYAFIRPAPYPGGYDIKIPWELSRCQHFAWLGQAYWFSGDEKYAQEFVAQVSHWIKENPPRWGVNWACTMDVAIRAVNWLWGYHFFKDSPALDENFLVSFFKSLLLHGRHILQNLERSEGLTTNHYLSNLVGLVYLGILLPEFKEAHTWREFGLSELEKEIFKQTTPDGVSFEASTSYHRLATELFLSATILAQLNGFSFSSKYMQRLEKMLEFIQAITRPDGTVPLFGDNDNGRLHRLKVWTDAAKEWVDFRYLLGIGAILFDRQDFAHAAGDQREESIWLYGQKAIDYWERFDQGEKSTAHGQSALFPDAGIGVLRSPDHYLAIIAGPNGQNGVGGHAHNHALSFEFYANGTTWILDPGTYTYTGDYPARNTFRSTAMHNTITIDGEEVNPLQPRQLFELRDIAQARIVDFESAEHTLCLSACHLGYNRLASPVTHHRLFLWKKSHPADWWMIDHLEGRGLHQVTLSLQLAPLKISMTSQGCVLVNSYGQSLKITFHSGQPMQVALTNSQYATGYGVCAENRALQYSGIISLPARIITRISCISQKSPEAGKSTTTMEQIE